MQRPPSNMKRDGHDVHANGPASGGWVERERHCLKFKFCLRVFDMVDWLFVWHKKRAAVSCRCIGAVQTKDFSHNARSRVKASEIRINGEMYVCKFAHVLFRGFEGGGEANVDCVVRTTHPQCTTSLSAIA